MKSKEVLGQYEHKKVDLIDLFALYILQVNIFNCSIPGHAYYLFIRLACPSRFST